MKTTRSRLPLCLRTIPINLTPGTQRGAILSGVLGLVVTVALLLTVLLFIFGTVVPPGAMGVRQIKFGPGQGFSERALAPGYHWSVPSYSTVHIVPRTVQILNFHRDEEGEQLGNSYPSLEIQSADRATVDVDVSILYRFLSEPNAAGAAPHGGPRDLFKLGTAPENWKNEVRRRGEEQLRRNLGQLQTAKFYQPDAREPLMEAAQREMNAALAPAGIAIEAVLLRRFSYRDEGIDNAIFQKNLQEQEERRNIAQSKFVEAEGLVKRVEAEKNAEIETIKVQGESNARVIRSEGDLFEAQRTAEADLLVAKSQAEADKLKSTALAQSAGANAFVARELAPLLSTLKGGIVSDLDPYDIQSWSKKLLGEPQAPAVGGGSK